LNITNAGRIKDETKRIAEAYHVLFIAAAVAEGGAIPPGVNVADLAGLN